MWLVFRWCGRLTELPLNFYELLRTLFFSWTFLNFLELYSKCFALHNYAFTQATHEPKSWYSSLALTHAISLSRHQQSFDQLESVAIANALQLEKPPEPRQPFFALIRTSCQVWCRRTNPLPYYSVLLQIHYFTLWPWLLTLWPWPLNFDLKHLQCIAYDVIKLHTKFERSRAIRGGVIPISIFDLMTLNMRYVLRSALG